MRSQPGALHVLHQAVRAGQAGIGGRGRPAVPRLRHDQPQALQALKDLRDRIAEPSPIELGEIGGEQIAEPGQRDVVWRQERGVLESPDLGGLERGQRRLEQAGDAALGVPA